VDPFLQCDIRGVYGSDITEDLARALGCAIGQLASRGRALIAGDHRVHTPSLKDALWRGLSSAGCRVLDCGQIPTPVYYFARRHKGIRTGVMVTASHNPPEYAGFKPILGDMPIRPDELKTIHGRMGHAKPAAMRGVLSRHNIAEPYRAFMREASSRLLPGGGGGIRILVDCGNGSFGSLAPSLLRRLGFRVDSLFIRPNGMFPNRLSNVALEEARRPAAWATKRHGADFGVAYDGDGDRIAFIDNHGRSVPNDVAIALLCEEALAHKPGAPVVYDIKCSRIVPEAIERAGGVPVVQKSGHTFMKRTMIERRAVFGGELSGHLFSPELHGGDDAL